MSTEHPITPPPELVQQWFTEGHHQDYCSSTTYAIHQAARWGGDQELEACCAWLLEEGAWPEEVASLRAARRPKPPSLKQQALEALQRAEEGWRPIPDDCDTIRRALEALPDD